MKFQKLLTTVDAHTEGEPVRLVTGIPNIRGETMTQKRDFVRQNLDHLRTALCDEPRGHSAMYACILTSPVSNDADFGIIFMWSPKSRKHYPDMCGHGLIGAAIIVVEMGLLEPREPITTVIFDTPAGTVHARVNIEDGKARSATIRNVPSFLYETALIKVPNLGELPVDIAFGGTFFCIVQAADIGVRLEAHDIARAGDLFTQIADSVKQQVEIRHPELDFITGFESFVINDKPRNPAANTLNVVVAGHVDNIDRSPCGTGTCAKMAALYAKGELGLGETYVTESIIGSLFYGKLVKEVSIAQFKAVVPEITGRAFVTGMHNFVMDEEDPFKYGFQL